MRLIHRETGKVIDAAVPEGPLGRARGLLGSPPPAPGQGVLLRGKQVHTLGLRYPIDAVYLSKAGEVLEVRTLGPFRLGPLVWRAKWVLELAGGEAEAFVSGGTFLIEEDAWQAG